MTKNLSLSAERHVSRILTDWVGARPGGMERAGLKNQTVISSNLDGMRDLFRSIPSSSGFEVTDKSAMLVSTVYACLSKLSGAILQLPLNKYRVDVEGDRKQMPRDALWWMLNESPAPAWTASSWKEWIVRCVALRGDQFTEIVRSQGGSSFGEPLSMKVHHPDYVIVRRVLDRLVYDVMDINTLKAYTVDQDDMLHFAGFGFDGLRSLSAIQTAAKSGIGNSLAASDYSGKSIGGGAMPQIALKYPNKMGDDQKKMLRDSFEATYGQGNGSSNARKLPLVLTEGADVQELSISPVDMELLSSRRFEREDICQALGVPPILIGDNDKSSNSYTGIEQITLGFVKYTVKPHLTRWEEEMNRKLFRNAGPFLEFDLDELLRGDSKAQAEADRAALGGAQGDGYKTVNEVRRSRNLPPLPGGDEIYKAQAKPNPAATDANAAATATASAQTAALVGAVAAFAAREPVASVINVATPAVNIAPAAIEIRAGDTNVTLPEGLVRVDNVVNTPAVKSGDVRVEVLPAPVHVQPAQATRQTISRDAAGDISQIETLPIVS